MLRMKAMFLNELFQNTNLKETFSSETMGLLRTELIAKEIPTFQKSLYNPCNFRMNLFTMTLNKFIYLNHLLEVLISVMKQEKKL